MIILQKGNRLATFIAVSLFGILMIGCGSSGNDLQFPPQSTNTTTNTAARTGNLTFQFTMNQALEVSDETDDLLFEFFNSNGEEVYSAEADFAATVTIEGVPETAVSVRIVSRDSNGVPLGSATQSVNVQVGQTATVDLSTSQVTPIQVSSLSVSPSSVSLEIAETAQLVGLLTFSDNSSITTAPSLLSFNSSNTAVATVNGSGTVTAVSAGTATITVAYTSSSGTITSDVSVTVEAEAVTTGDLSFNFVKAQSPAAVPASTANFRFEFFDSGDQLVLTTIVSFNSTVTITSVPITATSVRITALDNSAQALAFIESDVVVVAGQNTTVDLSNAVITPAP